MKFRFRVRHPGGRVRTLSVRVPAKSVFRVNLLDRQSFTFGYQYRGRIVVDVAPEFVAAFEARQRAEVLDIRPPYRRGR